MNRSSTARCVPPSVQIGFSFARASEESSRTVVCFPFDALEALRGKRDGCFLGEPTRRRPVLPGPAPPRRPATRRPAPTRPWFVRVFPGHALHQKGLQRHTGDGPLVSSQERRVLAVPRINPLSTAGFVPPSVYIGCYFVRASDESSRKVVLDALEEKRDGCLLGDLTRRPPVLPRPAPPRCPAVRRPPQDPPVICPGLGFYQFDSAFFYMLRNTAFPEHSKLNRNICVFGRRSPNPATAITEPKFPLTKRWHSVGHGTRSGFLAILYIALYLKRRPGRLSS